MNLTVKSNDLLRVVNTAIHGLPRHAIRPELGLMRLVAKGGKLYAMCGDGDFNVESWCDADVTMEGACLCIPEELLGAAELERDNDVVLKISKAPRDDLSVSGRMSFRGLTKAKLRIQSDFAFPRIDIGEPAGHVVLRKDHIKSLKVAGDSSAKGDAYALNVSIKNDCSTTFSKYTGMATFVRSEDTGAEAFIPLSFLERASKALEQSTYYLYTRANGTVAVQCTGENATCSFVSTNGKPLYPEPYLGVVPTHRLFFSTPISNVLKTAKIFADENAGHPCKIEYANGEVSFSAIQAESNIETPKIPVAIEGVDEPFSVTFRVTYLTMAALDMRREFWMNFCTRKDGIMYVQFEKANTMHVFMPLVTREVKERETE